MQFWFFYYFLYCTLKALGLEEFILVVKKKKASSHLTILNVKM